MDQDNIWKKDSIVIYTSVCVSQCYTSRNVRSESKRVLNDARHLDGGLFAASLFGILVFIALKCV